MFTSEVAVVKSHHGISVKCSRYRDTGTTDPSLVYTPAKTRIAVPVSHPGSVPPIHKTHGSYSSDEGQIDGFTQGYKNPPVLR